jgi:hypothetical protein
VTAGALEALAAHKRKKCTLPSQQRRCC